MLLNNHAYKVLNLLENFNNLNNIDKVRLTVYILENINFKVDYDINNIICLLKDILSKLDSNYNKVIVNFAKYKKLLFLSAKYMELSEIEKKKFSIEMLFNIYETDFNDEDINNTINQNLLIFDYVYSLKI